MSFFATSTTIPGTNPSDPLRPVPAATLAEIIDWARKANALARDELNNPCSNERKSCSVLLHSALAMRAVGIAGSIPMSPRTVIREISDRNLLTLPETAAYDELCYLLYRQARALNDAGVRPSIAVIMDILRARLGRWARHLSSEAMKRPEGEVRDAEVALTRARA